jgi:CelD/BcsL family acetyltransferase involved in cellulose biosynthesis
VTGTMTLETTLGCTEDCFDLPEWKELMKRDPNRHIFSTPEWNKTWWAEFKDDKELYILTMRRDGDIAALVPLYLKREAGKAILRFIGGIDLTDYLGPICSMEDRDPAAEATVEWLKDAPIGWDEFDAHNLPVPFGFGEFLVDHADRRGFDITLNQEDTSAVLVLPPSWEEYEGALDSKERHELRRKRRRLAREHPDVQMRSATEETLETDLKTFVEMHRGAEGMKGHFMRPEIATFFERMAHAFMPLGWLRLDLLEIGGSAVAATFGFQLERAFYLYNSAYEPEARRLSPGLVLVSELVKRAIDEGREQFDFLRGPERYKYQLGAEALPLNNVTILAEVAGSSGAG